MKTDLIHRNEILAALPRMSLWAFYNSRLYLQWLKIHEVRLSRRNVYFPKHEVEKAFKAERIPLGGI